MPIYQTPALEKGLDILEYLSSHNLPQSQTELAVGLNRSPNEIYRMLICLENRGYIVKDKVSGKFSLSLKLYHLSHQHSTVRLLRQAAEYPMLELAEYSRQSCHLSILHKNKVLVIAQSLNAGPISLSIEEGALFPIYGTTSGRMILSQMSKEKQLYHLKKEDLFMQASQQQQAEYLQEIEKISIDNSYIRQSETTEGVMDIAVALSATQMNIHAALVVTILSSQIHKPLAYKNILNKMQETVSNIHNNLGIS